MPPFMFGVLLPFSLKRDVRARNGNSSPDKVNYSLYRTLPAAKGKRIDREGRYHETLQPQYGIEETEAPTKK